MKKTHYFLLTLLVGWISCSEPEEEFSFDPNLQIIFSNDSVTFDTLVSNTRSSTRRLTVFNPNESALLLSEVSLGLQDGSDYQVIINGKERDAIFNERILGGDSLLVLIEVTIDPRNEDLPYLVKDSLVFSWNGNSEHVKLVSWGQDARSAGNELICTTTWTNERPYLISDTLVVGADCILTIEKGTNIFFENDAALFVQGSLIANGDSSEHIIFRNSRFDGIYDEVPGQWNGIFFLEGSDGNELSFTEIFNGRIGLRVGSPDEDNEPDVVVNNTRIFNMSEAGILAFTSDMEVTNTLIYNCGTYLAGHFIGGNYTYRHCTFSNDLSFFVSDQPAVQFADNIVLDNNEILSADLFFSISNSIIWGRSDEELLVSSGGGRDVVGLITTNIIRSEQELTGNFTSVEFNFPGFRNEFPFDYALDSLAFAKDKGSNIGVLNDIDDTVRDDLPDIGAFESVD
ncbi:MAG: right-handed parallel beta-helix repeat-containing protein [Bacteroidota bacterium]